MRLRETREGFFLCPLLPSARYADYDVFGFQRITYYVHVNEVCHKPIHCQFTVRAMMTKGDDYD